MGKTRLRETLKFIETGDWHLLHPSENRHKTLPGKSIAHIYLSFARYAEHMTSSSILYISLAGMPTAVHPEETLLKTTAFAPMLTSSPI